MFFYVVILGFTTGVVTSLVSSSDVMIIPAKIIMFFYLNMYKAP